MLSADDSRLCFALTFFFLVVIGFAHGQNEHRKPTTEKHSTLPAVPDGEKRAAFDWIDENSGSMTQLAVEIWNTPEVSFKEFKTSRVLMDYLEKNGFTVQRNAGGLPTAFVANYGAGKPVIALWTEEDALAGMSQEAVPVRQPLIQGGPGHACGHNLIGASTVMAAVAAAKYLQRSGTKGTIRVYGTPAEETGGGKEYMLEAGVFRDVDILLGWHPSGATRTEFEYTKAFAELRVHFRGVASHASASPELGRNALQAVELMDAGVNFLREQLKEDTRISYVITNGGGQPNVIPAEAESWYSIRANKHDDVAKLVQRITDVAKGAALMTGTQVDVRVDNDEPEVLPNRAMAEEIDGNLRLVGAPAFTDEDKAFALKMLGEAERTPRSAPSGVVPLAEEPHQEAYSTDLGNVSWRVPTERFAVGTSPYVLGAHSWQVAVNSASSGGLKALPIAAKTLAATAIDYFRNSTLIDAAKSDFKERSRSHVYTLMTPPDRKPPAYREGEDPLSPGSARQ